MICAGRFFGRPSRAPAPAWSFDQLAAIATDPHLTLAFPGLIVDWPNRRSWMHGEIRISFWTVNSEGTWKLLQSI